MRIILPSARFGTDRRVNLSGTGQLVQLGEALGMSIATVNRTLHELRASRTMDFQNGKLTVKNWQRLAEIGGFDPHYLHLKKAASTRASATL
jgi:hypothetical protein